MTIENIKEKTELTFYVNRKGTLNVKAIYDMGQGIKAYTSKTDIKNKTDVEGVYERILSTIAKLGKLQ